jgi:hypothetical protein
MGFHLCVRAHPRYLIVTNAFALLAVELLLFALTRVRLLLSPLALAVLGLAVFAGFAADVAIWFWTGIRSVDLSDTELTVFRGPLLSPQTVPKASIGRLRVQRFLGVGSVRLRTRSGVYLRLSESAFPREEFRRFLSEIEGWQR